MSAFEQDIKNWNEFNISTIYSLIYLACNFHIKTYKKNKGYGQKSPRPEAQMQEILKEREGKYRQINYFG